MTSELFKSKIVNCLIKTGGKNDDKVLYRGD